MCVFAWLCPPPFALQPPDKATRVPVSKKCKLDIKRKHLQVSQCMASGRCVAGAAQSHGAT